MWAELKASADLTTSCLTAHQLNLKKSQSAGNVRGTRRKVNSIRGRIIETVDHSLTAIQWNDIKKPFDRVCLCSIYIPIADVLEQVFLSINVTGVL